MRRYIVVKAEEARDKHEQKSRTQQININVARTIEWRCYPSNYSNNMIFVIVPDDLRGLSEMEADYGRD